MSNEIALHLPAEWATSPWMPAFTRVVGEVTLPRERTAVLLLGLLEDGTNILALAWDRGTRIARVSADTNWALQERFAGNPPGRDERAVITAVWRRGVEAIIQAGKDARAQLADQTYVMPPAAHCLTHKASMDRAYEVYRENAEQPVDRESFELGVQILAAEELERGASE